MRRGSIWAGTIILCLLCSLGLEAQQSDSSVTNNTNLPAASQSAAGTFPRLIKFTGGVKDLTGKVPTGVVGLTFSLYELPEGGSPLWTESQSLPLDSLGRYTALLGASSPGGLPLDLFTTGKTLWLGVQPQLPVHAEQPRVLLVAVPYALKASDSDTLGGRPASAYALAGSQTLVVPAAPSTITAQPGSQPVSTPAITSSPETACAAVTSDGTATANTVAKFTSACNVENSLIRDNGTGVAVGGTSAPGALLDVQYTSTGTSGSLLGHRVLSTFNPAAASSASNIGAISDAQTAAGNTQNFTGYLTAMNFSVNHYGKGTLAAEYGMIGYAVNSAAGTISKAVGAYTSLENVSTGTITNGYGMYVNSPVNSGGGKFSNYTGLYIANPSAVTGAYGLYSAGGLNYFGGNVGIGTATPGAALEVNGTAKFDGLVTFKSGQMFAGTGSVTSVATGLGLTGGPITTTGTLAIDTTVVPQLNTNNIFTGYDTFKGGYGWFQNGLYAEPFLDAYGAGNGTALYGFNNSTTSTNPTLYLENDDSTSAGDLVFNAVGASYGGQCTIDVSGNLFCTGTLGLATSTATTNQKVGLYTVQSSENWIEDFGSGALMNGVATVHIEPQFAQTVTTDASYHVFLTPNGDCEGLYVTQKGAASFEVHELKGGKSSVQFDYRIVAHRRGFETARLPNLTGKFQKKVQPPARPEAALASRH